MAKNTKKYVEELRQKIWYHAKKYYVDCQPEISDYEYDQLLSKLIAVEQENPELITPESPTQRVAPTPLSHFEKFTHKLPMLSIDNSYSLEEIQEFDARLRRLLKTDKEITYVVEPKIDGVAISLWYEKGILTNGVTRGDGKTGELVTSNVRTITAVPLHLMGTFPEILEVRGEVYLSGKEFKKANIDRQKAGQPLFANPRNAAAGTLKLLDAREVSKRSLGFFAHSIGFHKTLEAKSYSKTLDVFAQWGLPVNPNRQIAENVKKAMEICQSWENKKNTLPYDIDGMVIKVDDMALRQRLGNTSRAPRWVVAYKFAPEQACVRLKNVVIQVGKGGTLTPVAELEPVFLAGTTVSRASLHNFEDIARKDIRVGDLVTITKAGEIIPQVVRSHTDKRKGNEKVISPPENCPVCSGKVEKDEQGVFLRCINPECRGGFISRLKFFASRKGMDINGLGGKLCEQLVEEGLVEDFSDLYQLTIDDVVELERMGQKSAQKLIEGIEKSKDREPSRLLCALGIRHVGEHIARKIMAQYSGLDALAQESAEKLAEIDEVGPIVAEAIHQFFLGDYGSGLLEKLKKAGVRTEKKAEIKTTDDSPSPWQGKTVVLTGTLENFTRDRLKEIIIEGGGRVSSSVSKKTDMVIAGEAAGSKLDKALKLGLKVLDEKQLQKILANKNNKESGKAKNQQFDW